MARMDIQWAPAKGRSSRLAHAHPHPLRCSFDYSSNTTSNTDRKAIRAATRRTSAQVSHGRSALERCASWLNMRVLDVTRHSTWSHLIVVPCIVWIDSYSVKRDSYFDTPARATSPTSHVRRPVPVADSVTVRCGERHHQLTHYPLDTSIVHLHRTRIQIYRNGRKPSGWCPRRSNLLTSDLLPSSPLITGCKHRSVVRCASAPLSVRWDLSDLRSAFD